MDHLECKSHWIHILVIISKLQVEGLAYEELEAQHAWFECHDQGGTTL